MQTTLIIAVLATDRPGIVNSLSETIMAHNANWIDSRMANLADKFAGLVKISVPIDQLSSLQADLQALHDADNQLHILMEEASATVESATRSTLSLEVLGADRPGIIDDITGALASLDVNINELETEQREASMSSELLFYAHMRLGLPEGISDEDVRESLEALSDQLMVDLIFAD